MADDLANEAEPDLADAEVRRQLAALASRERTRTVAFSRARPTEWQPGSVRHPESGEPFNLRGSWNFVAECLEAGAEVRVVRLLKPAGRKGFEMVVPGFGNEEIYVKLQFSGNKVVGRSFHVSKQRRGGR